MQKATMVVCTVIVLCSLGAAESKAPPKGQISEVLLAAKPEHLDAAVKRIQDDLSASEERLIAIVKNRQRYTGLQVALPLAAIEILGRLRSRIAVPVLVDAIFFGYHESMTGREADSQFPAGKALIAIGDWNQVADALGNEKEENKRRLLAMVLLKMTGRPMMSRLMEEMSGYSHLSDEQRSRYKEAAGWLKPQTPPLP